MVAPSSLLYWNSSSSSSSSTAAATTTTTSMDGSTEKSCFNNGGLGEQEMRRTSSTTRGSSRNKSTGKVLTKKPPQRGLGVAQLERLRIQERWKKMTEFDASGMPQSQNHHQFPHHHHHLQFPFQEQQNLISSVPMIAATGFAFQEQHQICNLSSPTQPPPVNFVFNPYRSGGSSGVVRSVYSDQFQAGNGNINPFESSEASKELSSSQKKSSHCLYDKCDVCLKKKRMMNGEILGFEGGGAQYLERKSFVDGTDHFLGLDLGRNWTTTINGGDQIRRSSYSSGITSTINEDQEEVEVVAIHRKGNTSNPGGGSNSSSITSTVLMEYDFFPRKAASSGGSTRSNSSSSRSVVIKKEEQPVSLFGDQALVGHESSSSSAAMPTTNLLDLSLKLSC